MHVSSRLQWLLYLSSWYLETIVKKIRYSYLKSLNFTCTNDNGGQILYQALNLNTKLWMVCLNECINLWIIIIFDSAVDDFNNGVVLTNRTLKALISFEVRKNTMIDK